MKVFLLLSSIVAIAYGGEFAYDFCSFSHSAHVLDRLDQEVLPIYSRHKVSLRQACPFHQINLGLIRDQIMAFNNRKNMNKNECPRCKKSFKNSDYLEYHMKMMHFAERTVWSPQHDICLADYCDMFECKENPDKLLRHQVFMNREYNYEGKSANTRFETYGADKTDAQNTSLNALQLPKRVYTRDEVPDRYHIVSQLTEEMRTRLESQCSALFLNCIDFDMTSTEDAIMAYDTLFSLYCGKFQGVDLVEERINEREGQGIKSLIQEVEDWNMSPEGSFKHLKRQRTHDIWYVLRIIFGIFAVVLAALYYTGVYFTLFEEDSTRQALNRSFVKQQIERQEQQQQNRHPK